MPYSLNQVFLLGNLGQDPEVKYTDKEFCICTTSLATSHRVKNKQSGEYEEHTDWHRLCFLGQTAEYVGKFFRKGQKIHISGRLKTRSWEDKDGKTRYMTEVVCNDVINLSPKDENTKQREIQQPAHGTFDMDKSQHIHNNGMNEEDIPF